MDYFYGWKPYVSAAARKRQAERELAKLRKKGRTTSPVQIDGRKIATTFWGTAWCDNLERYSDFANRLPRGRTYVRNGSVIDLQMARGTVTALVSGSAIYEIRIDVTSVPKTRWRDVCRDCTGTIDSLVELLQGRLSSRVMTRICEPKTGLFPEPRELSFQCSCPDWASMCKHVAAVLYGVGARLDEQPELLFLLRGVDQQDLIAKADAGSLPAGHAGTSGKVLDTGDLSQIFGIEMADTSGGASARRRTRTPGPTEPRIGSRTKRTTPPENAGDAKPIAPPKVKTRERQKTARTATAKPIAPRRKTRALSPAWRNAVSERMKKYWAERLKTQKRR